MKNIFTNMIKGLLIFLFVYTIQAQNVLRYEYAKIASESISITDLKNIKCLNSEMNLTDYEAMVMLINSLLERALATKLELSPAKNEIWDLNSHVNNTSQQPERLALKKNCFKGDSQSYYRNIIEPIIINNKLHTYFAYDTVLQIIPRKKINDAYSLVSKGNSFQDVAKKLKMILYYDTLNFNDFNENNSALKNEEQFPYVIKNLKEGELYSKIVENNYQYSVVSLVSKNENTFIIIGIIQNKEFYDSWFQLNANFDINLYEMNLFNEIKDKFPTLWWIKQLKLIQ